MPERTPQRRSGPSIPSDAIATIRELVTLVPALQPLLGEIPRFDVIVDANVVLDEVEYLALSRRDPTARTALQELVSSSVVNVIAPPLLEAEVERHLPKIAARHRADVERLRAAWLEYRASLHFFEPDPVPEEERRAAADPDDVPYKALWLQLGARAIYTNDRHLRRMGAEIVRFELFMSLRDYARAASVELTIRFGSGMAVALSMGALQSLVALLRAVTGGVARLSREAKLVLGLLVLGLLLHPKSRRVALRGLKALPGFFSQVPEVLGPIVARASEELGSSSAAARKALEAAHAQLPEGPRRRTVRMRARAVCVASKEPLSVASIEARMRAEGYAPAGRTARQYLLRVLRSDARLHETRPGYWMAVRAAPSRS